MSAELYGFEADRSFWYQVEISFVDKSFDKNDKSPATNLSTNRERQKRQKRQKYRVQFIDFTSFCTVECIWWVTHLVCIANNTFLIENCVLQRVKIQVKLQTYFQI